LGQVSVPQHTVDESMRTALLAVWTGHGYR